MDFESKLSDLKIGGKNSNKQKSEQGNITNLYHVRYDRAHRKGLKILTNKHMLQILAIALAQVKASNSSGNILIEICQII